jgi:hypothetical protein
MAVCDSHKACCGWLSQRIVPEEEWPIFMEVLRKALPTTFRINGSGKYAADLRDKLEHDIFSRIGNEQTSVCALFTRVKGHAQEGMQV